MIVCVRTCFAIGHALTVLECRVLLYFRLPQQSRCPDSMASICKFRRKSSLSRWSPMSHIVTSTSKKSFRFVSLDENLRYQGDLPCLISWLVRVKKSFLEQNYLTMRHTLTGIWGNVQMHGIDCMVPAAQDIAHYWTKTKSSFLSVWASKKIKKINETESTRWRPSAWEGSWRVLRAAHAKKCGKYMSVMK